MGRDDVLPVSCFVGVLVMLGFSLILFYIYHNRPAYCCGSEESQRVVSDPILSADSKEEKKPTTTKQRKRQELKEEKRRQKFVKDEERKAKDKQIHERQDAYQQRREEKERQRQEDEIQRANEAYRAYKGVAASFIVEDEGSMLDHAPFNVEDFVNFVIWKKMTSIVELSARFTLPQSEVVNRLGQLETQGRLFGLLDERGRYLYVSASEVDTLDRFIHQSGRIHKDRDLAPFCNATVSLTPTKEAASKLRDWEQDAVRCIALEE